MNMYSQSLVVTIFTRSKAVSDRCAGGGYGYVRKLFAFVDAANSEVSVGTKRCAT